jgi:imidazole glycerol-phosphate synthase subunit HisH
MPKIVIVDYGMGNISSIEKKIKKIGYEPMVNHEIDIIKTADKLILPGVGHFSIGMAKLKERKLIEVLKYKALKEKTPILGICLGMQLFTNFSEEGNSEGLGWVDAETVKFILNDIRYKVPHMGWNSLEQKKDSLLLKDLTDDSHYYFVHSYHVRCNNQEDILTTTQYGYEFVSAIQKDNIFGTQFHPEKSHLQGEKMLMNFLTC